MLSRWEKIAAFLRKPTKLQLLAERIDNNRKVKAAAKECARLKEWNLVIIDRIDKNAKPIEIKALLSCALRGMTVTEVVQFNQSKIPQEIQK